MKQLTVFLLLVVVQLVSCRKEDNSIIYGYDYFPVDSGRYVVYDVIDIEHDESLLKHDTATYQIKEVIGEDYIDLEGDSAKKLYRYKRENSTTSWQLQDVWVIKKTNRSVEVVEENIRYIKLAFSISYDQFWDCNALNFKDEQQCYYRDIYKPLSLGGVDYDSTVVIEHEDFTSFIEYNRHFEVYARDVGRIQLYLKDLEIDQGDTLNVQRGSELFYTAVGYGN